MKVKVGNKIYDGEQEPVMVILTKQDKENIANMLPEANRYCMFPDTDEWIANEHEAIHKWMGEE